MEVTTTFKYTKNAVLREGYDPVATSDVIYFNHPERQEFLRLDKDLYERIQGRQVRL
jgi:fatty-acyl-CoA synthase